MTLIGGLASRAKPAECGCCASDGTAVGASATFGLSQGAAAASSSPGVSEAAGVCEFSADGACATRPSATFAAPAGAVAGASMAPASVAEGSSRGAARFSFELPVSGAELEKEISLKKPGATAGYSACIRAAIRAISGRRTWKMTTAMSAVTSASARHNRTTAHARIRLGRRRGSTAADGCAGGEAAAGGTAEGSNTDLTALAKRSSISLLDATPDYQPRFH